MLRTGRFPAIICPPAGLDEKCLDHRPERQSGVRAPNRVFSGTRYIVGFHGIYKGIYMSPRLSNMPTSGITTEFSSLELLANIAENIAEIRARDGMKAPEETQGYQTRGMSNDAVPGCSSTKDRMISDLSIKVTSASETGIADAERKKFKCSQCGTVLKSTRNLNRHIRNIHEIKQCQECPDCKKTFKNNGSLETHRINKHRDHKKEYKCDQCKKIFLSSSHLKRHTRLVHTTEPRKKCPDCVKTFKNNDYLDQHRKREHPRNGKPHKCNQCNNAFAYLSLLKLHESVHTNKRNHECSDCYRTYYNASSLNRHKTTQHSGKKKTLIWYKMRRRFFIKTNWKSTRGLMLQKKRHEKLLNVKYAKRNYPVDIPW